MIPRTPEAIASESFRIIRQHLSDHGYTFDPLGQTVVERIIHSTADFDFADLVRWSDGALATGITALRAGATVVTDVHMVRVGISATGLQELGGRVACFIDTEQVAARAAAEGTTRSVQNMRFAAEQGLLDQSLVAIGNAPTALDEIVRLIAAGARPALVLGMPVGFVGTVESKAALMRQTDVAWLVTTGYKGGSTVAVAAVNALIRLAQHRSNAAV